MGNEAKPLAGVYACTHCDNIEATEREVTCWKCGEGEMLWHRAEVVAYALRPADRGPESPIGLVTGD